MFFKEEQKMIPLHFLKMYFNVISLFLVILLPFSVAAESMKTIGITQIVEHPSLNAIREGIIEELEKQGFKEGETLTIFFESAQGNPVLATQIAQKFASLPFDVIIPISTPSAQAIVHKIKNIPVIFAAITDPVGAKVVSSLNAQEGNVTGVTDSPPLAEQLKLIETCIPYLKTLGVIYNPGEANSVAMIDTLKTLLKKKSITVHIATVSKSSDVQAAARSLVGDVDSIFIGNDNTVVLGLESLVKICLEAKKPLFVSDPDSVNRGGLAAYAYDHYQMGRQVGAMVARVLKGEKVKNMPVEQATDLKFSLNPATAQKLKITCEVIR